MAASKAAKMASRFPPTMIYGTAWKKDSTAGLVKEALQAGFRGIDTAAQPKHYDERLVGEGIRSALGSVEGLRREDLYVQTKFSSLYGQDPQHIPYDRNASVTEQVRASAASSLHNLRHVEASTSQEADSSSSSYLDCLILHSPLQTIEETLEAWTAMEALVPAQARSLGLSNVYNPALLDLVCDDRFSRVKPAVVQNRFYAGNGYDAAIRDACAERGIAYQSFWTLTANPELLASEPVAALAREAGVEVEPALYALVCGLGPRVSVLNGTTRAERMRGDLKAMETVEEFKARSGEQWRGLVARFQQLLVPSSED